MSDTPELPESLKKLLDEAADKGKAAADALHEFMKAHEPKCPHELALDASKREVVRLQAANDQLTESNKRLVERCSRMADDILDLRNRVPKDAK